MFEYNAAWFTRGLTDDLAHSSLPDVPDAEGPDEASPWDPCPCRQLGVFRADRHGCVALCKELFAELDRELDAWEAEHGWLYR